MYTFKILFSNTVYHRILNIVPYAIGLCCLYNSLHLLTPNSPSISPAPLFPLGNHKSVLCL